MILYHGTPASFDFPSLARAKTKRDFGAGFYLAENEIDSLTIAIKNGKAGTLYTYEIDDSKAMEELNILEFDDFSDECLSCIYNNRMNPSNKQYDDIDIIIGPTAGGNVNPLFERWRKNPPQMEDAIKEMRNSITDTSFGKQWCFLSERSLSYLTRIDEEEIERD